MGFWRHVVVDRFPRRVDCEYFAFDVSIGKRNLDASVVSASFSKQIG
jgi:hypothetical protein